MRRTSSGEPASCFAMATRQSTPQDSPNRRSTRVATDVVIEVQGEKFAYAGQTVTVNLHGALIRTAAKLTIGAPVSIHVHSTGKSAIARVVFVSSEDPSLYGVELKYPENVWGIADPPPDWVDLESGR